MVVDRDVEVVGEVADIGKAEKNIILILMMIFNLRGALPLAAAYRSDLSKKRTNYVIGMQI